jgi:hypothetical protein
MFRPISILTAICICATISIAQPVQTAEHLLGNGISVLGGLGHLAIRDQYISDEKYSGTLPSFGVSWLRGDTSSAYRLGFNYAGSSDIRNNNVSAQVMQSGLSLDYLYSVGEFRFLSHDVFAYIGPSTELFFYYRQQRIATGGNAFFSAYSFAFFLSASANSTLVVPISPVVSVESSARLALLSVGFRLTDFQDKSATLMKLVSPLSGVRGQIGFLLDYDMSDRVRLKTGYQFEICQSSSWEYLLSASDNVVLIITVRL